MSLLAGLLRRADAIRAKVTFIARPNGGWRCVLGGIEMPPHYAEGDTAEDALAEALRFAHVLGARPKMRPRKSR